MSDSNFDSDLVSIHSASEMQFIKSNVIFIKSSNIFFSLNESYIIFEFRFSYFKGSKFWIGYNDIHKEGSFIWTDGTSGILICWYLSLKWVWKVNILFSWELCQYAVVDLLIVNKNLDNYNSWSDGQPSNEHGEDCAEVHNL